MRKQHFAVRERCIYGPGVETTMNQLSARRSLVEYGGSKFRPLFQKVLLICAGVTAGMKSSRQDSIVRIDSRPVLTKS